MHLVLTMTELSQDIEKRRKCLTYALNKGVSLPESLEEELFVKLGNIAKTKGYDVALQYFTLISKKEKILLKTGLNMCITIPAIPHFLL